MMSRVQIRLSKQEGLFEWEDILELDAEIVGQLAIHETLSHPPYWTISHIPTGYAVCKCFLTKSLAVRCAHELSRVFNWASMNRAEYAAIMWETYRVCAEFSGVVKDWLKECQEKGLLA